MGESEDSEIVKLPRLRYLQLMFIEKKESSDWERGGR